MKGTNWVVSNMCADRSKQFLLFFLLVEGFDKLLYIPEMWSKVFVLFRFKVVYFSKVY